MKGTNTMNSMQNICENEKKRYENKGIDVDFNENMRCVQYKKDDNVLTALFDVEKDWGNITRFQYTDNTVTNKNVGKIFSDKRIIDDNGEPLLRAMYDEEDLPKIFQDIMDSYIFEREEIGVDKGNVYTLTDPDLTNDMTDSKAVIEFREKTDKCFNNIDGYNVKDIEDMVKDCVKEILEDNMIEAEVKRVALTGSRSRGIEHKKSDIDITIEVSSDLKEYALFNIINKEQIMCNGIAVDVNPIKEDETGTLDTYLPWADAYLTDHKRNLERALQNISEYTEREFGETKPDLSDLSKVDISDIALAYTQDEDTYLPIEVSADLTQCKMTYKYDGEVAREEYYGSLEDMNRNALSVLDFEDLVSLSDDEKANAEAKKQIFENNKVKARKRDNYERE